MRASPPQPRRTVPIIVLDRVVAVAGSVRRALTGRGDGFRVAWVAAIASLAVLVVTAIPVIRVLRTPEHLAPVALDPPPGADLPRTPEVVKPGVQARTAVPSPPEAAGPTTTGAPPVAPPAPPVAPPTANGSSSAATAPAAPAALRADFAVENAALLSYGAGVTISNDGRTQVTGWRLVITLPRESLEVTSVTGARATHEGATWTFVPDGTTGQVPGDSSVRVTFRVDGAPTSSTPTACTIDGAACAGVPE